MFRVGTNATANYLGTLFAGGIAFFAIPLYYWFLGAEAYGIVGLYLVFESLLLPLDMSLAGTMNRELSRISVSEDSSETSRGFVRSLEYPVIIVGLFFGLIIILASSFIADNWLKVQKISPESVSFALVLMGALITVRCPFLLYSSSLVGLQRQVLYNVLLVGNTTLKTGGSFIVLWKVSGTIEAFFLWQIAASCCETALARYALYKSLPRTEELESRPSWRKLLRLRQFSAGLGGIGVTALILTQMDKIVLSKILPLDLFGNYMLIWAISGIVLKCSAPLYTSFFPQLARITYSDDRSRLIAFYHSCCQIMAVIVVPVSITLILYSQSILGLASGNRAIADSSALAMSLLVVGNMCSALYQIPYALQLAYGWTSLNLMINSAAIVVLLPLLWLFATHFGIVGAATIWLLINGSYLLFGIPAMHRKILPAEKIVYYIQDLARPALPAILTAILLFFLMPKQENWVVLAASALFVLSASGITSLLAAGRVRSLAFDLFRHRDNIWKKLSESSYTDHR
ncbi:lipopolysaccharide biosynthesis protein [Desulfomonile tiedjei]|uniref:Membrane protein involved in the export of O-antigen and teichoic acid n=1 Tax=Desulfomonile tiedjei (strain ATCC 49306 / DSM 6799 / DCB-1) TaxID=706587 RepID=I4C1Q2_DESTA|nr:oligosaccharide flippase family protein [Desulfomonile tiedjei]AFM23493.1 membrane protein involved in the export of O-antigen and teichoic acid [Desulfomonile tiedjei DSM 6799]